MKKSVRYNIGIFPPLLVKKQALQLSRELKPLGGLFVLNAKNCHPHITFYMTDFPVKHELKIKNAIRSIASVTKPISLRAVAYMQNTENGFIDVSFSKSPAIMALQKKLLRELNSLREDVPAFHDILASFTTREQNVTRRWGYPAVGELFRPHLTLTRLKKNKRRRFDISKPKSIFLCTAATIYVAIAGPHGTCRRVIALYPLNASAKK